MEVRNLANLIADLDDSRFDRTVVHHAIEALDRECGVRVERFHHTPESLLAWIDLNFGGSWSSEAARGGSWVARDASGPVGFCAYDPRGLQFSWLRTAALSDGVGIFGPFGVLPAVRGSGIARVLLAAAMMSLAERGYRRALVPAVGGRLVAYYERVAGARVVDRYPLPWPRRPYRTVVLASGNGTNFQAVVDAVADGRLPLRIESLVVNRADAFAIERARRAQIPPRVVAWNRRTIARDAYDDQVVEAVTASDPELVLLLGWMHVLPERFVARFPELLNIHPALLPFDPDAHHVTMPDGEVTPVFRGAHPVDDALAAGVGWIGASVHRVGVAVDRGEVLTRAPLQREPGESRIELDGRLHALEHVVLERAIRRWTFERPE